MSQQNYRRSWTLLSIILAGEAIFFLPFVLPRIFRPTMLSALEISNVELGTYFSVYGIVAMVAYVFGGILADLISSKKIMAFSLWLTAAGGLFLSFNLSATWMPWLYGFWGITSILLFWSAMIKSTKAWGGSNAQGRAFGLLEGGRGTIAAVLGTIAYFLFAGNYDADDVVNESANNKAALRIVILVLSVFVAVVGFIIWRLVPENSSSKVEKSANSVDWKGFLLNRNLWVLSLVIVCAYVGYKMTDEFAQFSHEILGFDMEVAAGIGTLALWMRAIVAFSSGYLGDLFGNKAMIRFGFLMASTGSLAIVFNESNYVAAALLLMGITAIGLYSVRALYFAVLERSNIGNQHAGKAIGLVSFIGFTPDVFVGPWMGHYLDTYPGIEGHKYVWLMMFGFALFGFLLTFLMKRTDTKKAQPKVEPV